MTVDQIIALLASVGACLAAVASFLTVRQMAKQREDPYRPELALSLSDFEGSKHPLTTSVLPLFWVKRGECDAMDKRDPTLKIPLQNVGLGTAKGVKFAWSFPIVDVVARVNELAQRTFTPTYFTYEDGAVSAKSDTLGGGIWFWKNEEKGRIDYVLPAAVQKEPVNLRVPGAYVFLCSALLFLGLKDTKSFPEFPVLRITFEYRDIGEHEHQAAFDVALHIVMVGGEGELFHGYLESTKAD